MGGSAITFGSWCSGIEAASEAWLPLGWRCAYVAEIEPFPCAYLHQTHGAGRPRYMPKPEEAADLVERRRREAANRANRKLPAEGRLTNLGDISQVRAAELAPVDIIAAGFPCQDFSIAGLRASLAGGRGSLSIIGVRLLLEAADLGLVRGAVLEQVPDVLNTEDNAWGNILGALVGADAALEGLDHGGKWPRAGMVAGPRSRVAWRILDAQHFGLAQRRERVWAVVDFGDGPDPAAVLFERKGMPGHPPARAQARQGIAPTLAARSRGGGGLGTDFDLDGGLICDGPQRRAAFGGNNTSGPIDIATARTASHTASHTASGRQDFETETFVVDGEYGAYRSSEVAATLRANGGDAGLGSEAMVAHSLRGEGFDASEDGTGRGTPIVPVAYSIMPQNSGKDYKAREVDVAQPVMAGGPVGGNQGGDYIVAPVAFNARQDPISGPLVGPLDTDGATHAIAFSLRGREGGAMPEVEGEDVVPSLRAADGGSTRPFVAFQTHGSNVGVEEDLAGTLRGNIDRASGSAPMIAFDETQITSKANRSNPQPGDPCHPLAAQGRPPTLANEMAVRRITVVEAEILQGFHPNATLIDWPSANRKGDDLAQTVAYLIGHGFSPERAAELAQTPDGPRYKAIGNSWPVPVPRWIGERINIVWQARAA